jgi:hypothetical protein
LIKKTKIVPACNKINQNKLHEAKHFALKKAFEIRAFLGLKKKTKIRLKI